MGSTAGRAGTAGRAATTAGAGTTARAGTAVLVWLGAAAVAVAIALAGYVGAVGFLPGDVGNAATGRADGATTDVLGG